MNNSRWKWIAGTVTAIALGVGGFVLGHTTLEGHPVMVERVQSVLDQHDELIGMIRRLNENVEANTRAIERLVVIVERIDRQ